LRLYLVCARDGTPIGFEPAPANAPEREPAKEPLERLPPAGYVLIADKRFAGEDFEGFVADQGATLLRPDRRNQQPRFGSPGFIRQLHRIGLLDCNGQLGLERHGARTLPGPRARTGTRPLTPAAGLRHNRQTGQPGRHYTAHAHQFGTNHLGRRAAVRSTTSGRTRTSNQGTESQALAEQQATTAATPSVEAAEVDSSPMPTQLPSAGITEEILALAQNGCSAIQATLQVQHGCKNHCKGPAEHCPGRHRGRGRRGSVCQTLQLVWQLREGGAPYG
jgi:hypothetical protein